MPPRPPSLQDDARRAILAHLPDDRRPALANRFLAAVRRGHRAPADVLATVLDDLRAALGAWGREDPATRDQLAVLLLNRREALAFAAWCLEWEALPPEEKAREKAARAAAHRAAFLEAQPPTLRQLRYLKALGYRGEIRSKGHASELIDQLRRARVA